MIVCRGARHSAGGRQYQSALVTELNYSPIGVLLGAPSTGRRRRQLDAFSGVKKVGQTN